MAELVDALDLGSSGETRGGSSPLSRTIILFGLLQTPLKQGFLPSVAAEMQVKHLKCSQVCSQTQRAAAPRAVLSPLRRGPPNRHRGGPVVRPPNAGYRPRLQKAVLKTCSPSADGGWWCLLRKGRRLKDRFVRWLYYEILRFSGG